MIITFNGDEGSGKTTIAKMIADYFEIPRYYMGQIARKMAKERGMTLLNFLELAEKDPSIDQEIDQFVKSLAKRETDFVIESRTAWYFIPQSLKIYLKVDPQEAAKRIFKEIQIKNERNEGSLKELNSPQKVLAMIKKRQTVDDLRYQKYYGINIRDPKNFDLIVDTTNLSVKEVFLKVRNFILDKQGQFKVVK